MANILREAALNYHLNPLLATMCAHEVLLLKYFQNKSLFKINILTSIVLIWNRLKQSVEQMKMIPEL